MLFALNFVDKAHKCQILAINAKNFIKLIIPVELLKNSNLGIYTQGLAENNAMFGM